jgi:neutral ceramidase
MKKIGMIIGAIIGTLVCITLLLFFLLTTCIDSTPYFNTSYYKKTEARIDSLKKSLTVHNDSIKAGFAKVSITPSIGNLEDNVESGKFKTAPLAGFGARKGKVTTGVHDSVFVKAAAIKVGTQLVVIVGADILIMPPNIIDEATLVLEKQGIHRSQVFYSASHTHSSIGGWGPGFIGEQFAGKANPNINQWLVLQISQAVTAAIADLHPARIGNGSFNASRYTRNRIVGESGTKNSDFSFISIEQTGGRKAVIGSFGAHATTMGADNMEFSADYPGYWQRKMENGSVDLAIFCGGSVGSQSPFGEGKGFEKPKNMGESLADSCNIYLPKLELKDKTDLSSMTLQMALPEYHIRLTQKINFTTWLSKKLMPLPENVYLQVIKIGNLLWITTPGDFSGEFALQLKNSLATKGLNANVTSFNGSYIGYVIPGKYFYLDSYEPKTMGWFGPNMGEYTFELLRHLSDIIAEPANKKTERND